MRNQLAVLLLLIAGINACDDGGTSINTDGGARPDTDVGHAADGGRTDAARSDTGRPDAAPRDASTDALTPVDGATDASVDAVADSAPTDAMPQRSDAEPDAELADSGLDAEPDSEPTDSGQDAELADSSQHAQPDAELADLGPDAAPDAEVLVPDLGPPPPLDTEITAGPPLWTRLVRPVFRFGSNRGGARFECRLDADAWQDCVSPWSPGPLEAERAYTAEVRAVVGAVADATPANWPFNLDVTPPLLRVEGGPPDVTDLRAATFDVIVEDADEVRCDLDGLPLAPCPGALELVQLGEGPRTLTARATDLAGNATEIQRSWEIVRTSDERPALEERRFNLRSKNQQYIADASGGAHLIYGRDRLLYQFGRPWQPAPEVVAAVPVGAERALALGPDGHPHVVYLNQLAETLEYAWRDAAGTWHREDTGLIGALRATRWGSDHLSLAVTADGTPHMVFYMQDAGRNLMHAWRGPDGWHEQAVAPGLANDGQIGLTLGADGRLWTAWCDGSRGGTWFSLAWLNPLQIQAGWTTEALPLLDNNCRDIAPPAVLGVAPDGRLTAILGAFAGWRDANTGWTFLPMPPMASPAFAVLQWLPEAALPVGWGMSTSSGAEQRLNRWTWTDGNLESTRSVRRLQFPYEGSVFSFLADADQVWALRGDEVSAREYPLGPTAELPAQPTPIDLGWMPELDRNVRLFADPEGHMTFLAPVEGDGLGATGHWHAFASDGWAGIAELELPEAIAGDDGLTYGLIYGRQRVDIFRPNGEVVSLAAGNARPIAVHADASGRLAALFVEPSTLVIASEAAGGEPEVVPLPAPANPNWVCPGLLTGGADRGWDVVRQCASPAESVRPFEALRWHAGAWVIGPPGPANGWLRASRSGAGRLVALGCEYEGGPILIAWDASGVQVVRPQAPAGAGQLECDYQQDLTLSGDGRISTALRAVFRTAAPLDDPFGQRIGASTLWLYTERTDGWRTDPLGATRERAILGTDGEGAVWVLWRDERLNRLRIVRR